MLFTLLSKQTAPRKTSLMTTAEAAKIGSISPTGFKDPLAPLKEKESGDMASRTIDFFTVRHHLSSVQEPKVRNHFLNFLIGH